MASWGPTPLTNCTGVLRGSLLRAAGLLSGLVLLGFAVTFGLRGFLAITPWFRP